MPVIHLEALISADELIAAAGQLGQSEMDQLVTKLLALRAQRRAPSLPAEESVLLAQINEGIAVEIRERYEALLERRRAGMLSQDEHAELLDLTDRMEAADAERLEHLAILARLRGVSLDALMQSLGIQAADYA